MLRGTATERQTIRTILFSGSGTINVGEANDGTWFADVNSHVIEAGSAAAVLRELAFILEET